MNCISVCDLTRNKASINKIKIHISKFLGESKGSENFKNKSLHNS